MKRADVLDKAKKCVCGEREQDYGTPENNFGLIGRLWSDYLAAAHPADPAIKVTSDCVTTTLTPYHLTAKDVAVMMALLKIVRIATGNSADSYIDLAGYAACAAEVSGALETVMTYTKQSEPVFKKENLCACCDAPVPAGVELCDACKATGNKRCGNCGSYFPASLFKCCPNCGEPG